MAIAALGNQVVSVAKGIAPRAVGVARTEDEIRRDLPNVYKSFLVTRLLVGIVGVLLPTFLIVWDLTADTIAHRPWDLRGSLSAYYYHPMPLRDWFVGSLWAIGIGLMVYMGNRPRSLANWVSWIAGFAAIAVAILPTSDGADHPVWTATIHLTSAAIVIIGLGLLCVGFGIDDQRRTDAGADAKRRRRGLHYLAGGLIFVAVAFVPLNGWLGIWPAHGVLAAEVLAVYAFAVSWFMKGFEFFEYARRAASEP